MIISLRQQYDDPRNKVLQLYLLEHDDILQRIENKIQYLQNTESYKGNPKFYYHLDIQTGDDEL